MLDWPHRMFDAALDWLDRQWNEPDRHDHYMMQVAAVMGGVRDTNTLKIRFKQPTLTHEQAKNLPPGFPRPVTKAQAARVSTVQSMLAAGIQPDKIKDLLQGSSGNGKGGG